MNSRIPVRKGTDKGSSKSLTKAKSKELKVSINNANTNLAQVSKEALPSWKGQRYEQYSTTTTRTFSEVTKPPRPFSNSPLPIASKSKKKLHFPITSTPKDSKLKHEGSSSNTDAPLQEEFCTTPKPTLSGDITEVEIREWVTLLDKNFRLSLAAEIFEYTKDFDNPEVKSYFGAVLGQHFKEIVEMEEYVHQKLNFVCYLLQLDELLITSELQVFDAAIKWLTFDWPLRKANAPLILETIRFALMTNDEWGTCLSILDKEAVGLLTTCQDILYQAMVYKVALNAGHERDFEHFSPRQRIRLKPNSNTNASTKKSVSFQQDSPQDIDKNSGDAALIDISLQEIHLKSAILCFAGLDPVQISNWPNRGRTILGFKPMEKEWKCVGNIPESRSYLAATVAHDKIYISGGFNPQVLDQSMGSIVQNTFWCLDPKGNGWQMLSPMLLPRAHHCMVAAFDSIYVIGGMSNSGGPLDAMECYSLSSRFWKEVSPLPVACLGMAACEYRGTIWICGGIGGTERNPRRGRIMDVVFTYDPEQNLWHFGTALRIPRAFGNLVEFEGSLHIIGGITVPNADTGRSSSLSTIDMFHNHTQRWVLKSDLLLARHSAAAAVTGDRLYVIGGITIEGTTANVECYDGSIRQWLTDVPPLPIPLSGLSCVVLFI